MSQQGQEVLKKVFGFGAFRPGQERVIDALLDHGAALAVFPTGGGKSLCYQHPALMLEGLTLVVSPLIALMKDQIDFLTRTGIAAARLDSSLTAEEVAEVNGRLRNGELKLLYVAPERLHNERFLEEMKHTRIALFAVDEAHCISEWGHNFRPDYLTLARISREIGAERVLALTATATQAVVQDICNGFAIPSSGAVVTGFYRPNLNLLITPVTEEARDALLLKRIRSRKAGCTIVYVTLQRTAERVAVLLRDAGLPAEAYHAGMDAQVRSDIQDRWMRSKEGIIVATIAFGMGIDRPDVRYVYHYNLPKGLESYSQEIGRAGRDGLRSTVELLACPADVPVLENFVYGDTPTADAVSGLIHEVLTAPQDLAENPDLAPNELAVNLYELSGRYDIRPLVLKTVLTYLELLGALREGTPFYASFRFRLNTPIDEILAKISEDDGAFTTQVMEQASMGRIWYSLSPSAAALALGQERSRVLGLLSMLEQKGCIELAASDARQKYTRLHHEMPEADITAQVIARFERREEQETCRIQDVLRLVTSDTCQTNALVGYFGEQRDAPCGHCGVCVTGRSNALPPEAPQLPMPGGLDTNRFSALRLEHPNALRESRQAARFLCGLSSPALTRDKLTRHALFGALDDRRFREVMAWCEG